MEKSWSVLYKEAKNIINAQSIPPFIEYGNNSCVILTENDKIYTGLSIASNTNICSSAEKTAITLMLNDGERKIKKMIILNELEEVILPSPDCIEYLTEFTDNPDDLEILVDFEKKEVVTLKDVIPEWWGTYRNKKN